MTEPSDTLATAPTVAISVDGCPEWIELLPPGSFRGRDGRGPWKVLDPERVIAASRELAGGMDLPIDYGHASEYGSFGAAAMGAEAAGWIVELQAREGGVWGRVEWTDPGAAKVKARLYRGISPVFLHDRNGVVGRIVSAGLTNTPNLAIRSLNAREGIQETMTVDEQKAIWGRITGALGLPATADADAVIARCSAALEAEQTLGKVSTIFTLPTTATADDVVRTAQSVQTRSTTAPDPSKFIPVEQHEAVCAELTRVTNAQVDEAVDQAVRDGKLTPANKDWGRSLASSNRKAFDEFVAKQPAIVGENKHQVSTTKDTLTDAERAICAQTGVSEVDFLKNREKK